MTALYFLPWALAIAVLAAWVIRQSHRIGYLEGQLGAWKRRDMAREMMGHYGAGIASLPGFTVASRAELFDPPPPPVGTAVMGIDQVPDAVRQAIEREHGHYVPQGMPPGWDGWNNYHGATGPAGVWAQRDRDRREGRR